MSHITVVKRDGSVEPCDGHKIAWAIEDAGVGLDTEVVRATQLLSELEITLFDGITSEQLDEAVIQVALQNVRDDPQFDTVAARLLRKTIYKRVLGDYDTPAELAALHRRRRGASSPPWHMTVHPRSADGSPPTPRRRPPSSPPSPSTPIPRCAASFPGHGTGNHPDQHKERP